MTCDGLGPLVVYDGRLNSIKYIDILETNLPTTFQKFPSHQVQQILYQQDNAGPHVSAMTQEYFKRKGLKQLSWPANSPDLNIIENVWSIVDNKLLKFDIKNADDLKNALQIIWTNIADDTIKKLFESIPRRLRQVIISKGFASRS